MSKNKTKDKLISKDKKLIIESDVENWNLRDLWLLLSSMRLKYWGSLIGFQIAILTVAWGAFGIFNNSDNNIVAATSPNIFKEFDKYIGKYKEQDSPRQSFRMMDKFEVIPRGSTFNISRMPNDYNLVGEETSYHDVYYIESDTNKVFVGSYYAIWSFKQYIHSDTSIDTLDLTGYPDDRYSFEELAFHPNDFTPIRSLELEAWKNYIKSEYKTSICKIVKKEAVITRYIWFNKEHENREPDDINNFQIKKY